MEFWNSRILEYSVVLYKGHCGFSKFGNLNLALCVYLAFALIHFCYFVLLRFSRISIKFDISDLSSH